MELNPGAFRKEINKAVASGVFKGSKFYADVAASCAVPVRLYLPILEVMEAVLSVQHTYIKVISFPVPQVELSGFLVGSVIWVWSGINYTYKAGGLDKLQDEQLGNIANCTVVVEHIGGVKNLLASAGDRYLI